MFPPTPETVTPETKKLPAWAVRYLKRFLAWFLTWVRPIASQRRFRITAYAIGIPLLIAILTGTVFYVRYSHLIDARLRDGPFRDSVNIYAAPLVVSVGDALTPADLVAELRMAAFAPASGEISAQSNAGSYRLTGGGVKISPAGSPGSSTTVFFANNQITRILADRKEVGECSLGSPLITTLS